MQNKNKFSGFRPQRDEDGTFYSSKATRFENPRRGNLLCADFFGITNAGLFIKVTSSGQSIEGGNSQLVPGEQCPVDADPTAFASELSAPPYGISPAAAPTFEDLYRRTAQRQVGKAKDTPSEDSAPQFDSGAAGKNSE